MQFPIIAPKLDLPMPFIVPAYLIPPLAFFIAYRSPFWGLLVLVGWRCQCWCRRSTWVAYGSCITCC
jgi:hypothetical protein